MESFVRSAMVAVAMWLCAWVPCKAETFLYKATCDKSYSKQGEDSADLTKIPGRPVHCDYLVLSFLENGHVLIQVGEKRANITPLGFGGSGLDYDANPNFVTVPIDRIYFPHQSRPGTPESVGGVEGFCFLGGRINVRRLSDISCAAKIEIGMQKLIYHINVDVIGIGSPVPGT